MVKRIMMFIFSITPLFMFQSSQPSYQSIPLKHYASDSSFRQLMFLHSFDLLGDIIVLPNEPFDHVEAASIITRVDRLPESMLLKLREKEIKMKLFEGKLTDNPTVKHLRGQTPRGYEKIGTKWDEVPGIGGSKLILVKIGHSEKGKSHGSINLELHELAHSIDRYLYNEIRHQEDFQKIWKEERGAVFPNNAYFLKYPEEYFAESFAMYHLNEQTNSNLKKNAPKTYAFIQNLK
ncbi:toxin [Bacillus aquiflavi]|uniref:anthrax toxin lethal factor-related metalloendopeptidase n=1 Tax=Bacillus aquiflavi TaxID=2672567 RepID=UPI001CA9D6ED|nr:toxin [Bacillus aquiflavi]UAC46961.1 toxin [Bacillus aquiflavi]